MVAAAEKETGDTTIALAAGQSARPATFLDVGQALTCCASLRQVLEVNRRYQPLTQQLGKTCLLVDQSAAKIHWQPYIDDPERTRPARRGRFCRLCRDRALADLAAQ